jgi:hypothetical protein
MSKGKDLDTALLATTLGNSGGTAQDQLAAVLTRKFLQQEAEEAAREEQQKRLREQQLESVRRQMAERAMNQSMCPHMKPNFTPAIGGQRDHNNDYHWLCQYCGKEWTNGELPVHLRIPADRVGGPQV